MCSSDATPEIAREYAARDPRVSVLRNDGRLGLVDNSRKAFSDCAGSGIRRPSISRGRAITISGIRAGCSNSSMRSMRNPDVLLAYPLNRRIGPSGELLKRKPWVFDTFGVTNRWTRLRAGIREMRAGNMVYGLYRVGSLERAGVYRKVVVPDRLLIAELSLYGQFKQVPEVLWFRRWYGRVFSLERQRANFFPGGRPLYAYCPWWIAHAVSLLHTFTIRGDGPA